MDDATRSVRVERQARDYRGMVVDARISVAKRRVPRLKPGAASMLLELADSALRAACVIAMVITPVALAPVVLALVAQSDPWVLLVAPIAAGISIGTLHFGFRAKKTTSRILGELRLRCLAPRIRREQTLNCTLRGQTNCRRNVRVVESKTGNAIELSTDADESVRVFEGLTPGETALVVQALHQA